MARAHRDYVRDISIVAVVTVLIRLPLLIFIRHGIVWDTTYYYSAAKSMAAGHGYSILGHPTAFFPVGWPMFLGALFLFTGPSIWAILVINVVLWAVISGLVYLLGRRMGGRTTGLVASLIIATSPTLALYVLRAYSEALFIPLLLVVCLLLTTRREVPTLRIAALAGLCLGLAILVRSNAAPLVVLLPLWLIVRNSPRVAWQPAALICAVSCAVVVPWLIRNAVVMHTVALSTNGGYTLFVGDSASPAIVNLETVPWGIATAREEKQQNSQLTHASITYVRRHPGVWLHRVPHKFEHLMDWTVSPILNALRYQHTNDPTGPLTYTRPASLRGADGTFVRGMLDNAWIFRVWHYLFWTLGMIALVLATVRRKPGASLALLLVAFWIVFHSVFVFGDVRFMISVTPLLAPALAWMLVRAVGYSPAGKKD